MGECQLGGYVLGAGDGYNGILGQGVGAFNGTPFENIGGDKQYRLNLAPRISRKNLCRTETYLESPLKGKGDQGFVSPLL